MYFWMIINIFYNNYSEQPIGMLLTRDSVLPLAKPLTLSATTSKQRWDRPAKSSVKQAMGWNST